MSSIRNIFRTTAVRLSALFILLFGLVAFATVFYMTKLAFTMVQNETRLALAEEVASIESAYEHGGIPLLVRTIDRRSRQPGAFLYLVTDPVGRILAGNVSNIEPGLLKNADHLNEPIYYGRLGDGNKINDHQALVMLINLPNGMKVMIGRDLGDPKKFAEVLNKSLLFAFSAVAIGTFLIWFFIGRRALQRIDTITLASRRLMSGDLTGRLPVSGSGDEFDRLTSNLNVMLEKIEELNAGLRHVSDNIAHDLKTPLTRLRNKAEQALSNDDSENYRAALNQVLDESDQLIRTFNAILMISRIEAGNTSVEHKKANLRQIVEDVAELCEPVAEEAGVHMILEHLLDVNIDASRELVAQTIFNLTDNAIKYAVLDNHCPQITLSMEMNDDNYVSVIVSDNGPGIPESEREKVTERFYRLEKSRTQQGSGIGLSLAKAVMRLHGGSLVFEDAKPGLKAVLIFPIIQKQS
ncbi:HAMP domain-containing histidine kinase [Bartonella sp. HY329]|uniref:sensor histidine kinase n=1 Tax=unclassified Bartonella TaxID=2645622 RepID=UPI0021C874B8|nr:MULTISPECIES: HAMP domain-containing sensor histidine kinase [unclassified Bartonella]UXM96382.1 HAMP domain-containing histidine kinase [Bartonella sp. HY329]UXN10706.1 HAMP domain-containing histidine kinase [Bartonella sp. HY328]